jgi:hypothetical protein
MRCMHTRPAEGPDLDVPVLDYVLLLALLLACLAPMFVLR